MFGGDAILIGALISNAAATWLSEYDRAEWQDVARRLKPDWTEEDFDRAWSDFQAAKAKREAN